MGFSRGHPLGGWIEVAALAEYIGAWPLADIVLRLLIARVDEYTALADARVPVTPREALALCWARRGRIARTAGRLTDADVFYRRAVALTRGLSWSDGRPHAEMGLAVLSVGRGNYPSAERRAQRVLAYRPVVYSMYRIAAHQVIAFTKRRRGQPLDALLHSWEAYDLLDRDDDRRFEILSSMSEIAQSHGDLDAAARGFAAVATSQAPWRVRIPGLVGALDVALLIAARDSQASRNVLADARVQCARAALEDALPHVAAPGDRLLGTLALAQAAVTAGVREVAELWLRESEELADRHGFHEKRFRVETLRASMHSAESLVGNPDGRAAETTTSRRSWSAEHPALARLRTLAVV
ncbi:MAG: hypothetical protein V4617_08125 [Gemmatimonadota bacterium]